MKAKAKTKELISNFANVMPLLSGNVGFPVPEKYPPSYVLVPNRKAPFIKIMKGKEYLRLRRYGLI